MGEQNATQGDLQIVVSADGSTRRSAQFHEFTKAMAEAQKEIEPAPKDRVGKVQSERANYTYYYADLAGVREACRIPLAKNGIAVIQTPHVEGNSVTVTTLLSHVSGQWIENDLKLTASGLDPQRIGACMTYGRRYGLSALVGIASEMDEDAAGGDQKLAPLRPPGTKAPTDVDPLTPAKREQAIRADKPESGSIDDGEQALRAAGNADTPDAFAVALARILNLPKTAQIEPRIALVRQIDLYLGKDGNQPSVDLGKLMFRLISGLPEDQRDLAQQVYARYKWPKSTNGSGPVAGA